MDDLSNLLAVLRLVPAGLAGPSRELAYDIGVGFVGRLATPSRL